MKIGLLASGMLAVRRKTDLLWLVSKEISLKVGPCRNVFKEIGLLKGRTFREFSRHGFPESLTFWRAPIC